MTEDEARWYRQKFYDEEMKKPLEYVKHYTTAHDNDKIGELVYEHGFAYYGMYWLLVECLARKPGHVYETSKERDAHRLRSDMNALAPVSDEELARFLGTLAELRLIDRDSWKERGRVVIERIIENAETAAGSKAGRRLGGKMRRLSADRDA